MLAYLDTVSGVLSAHSYDRTATALTVKRGQLPFSICTIQNGVPTPLPDGSQLIFVARPLGKFEGDVVTSCTLASTSTTSVDSTYTASLNANTAPIKAGLKVDGDPTDDVATFSCSGEFAWRTSSDAPWSRSQTVSVVFQNAIIEDSVEYITPAVLTSPIHVANAAARLALTSVQVREGQVVHQDDTGVKYLIFNVTALGTENAFFALVPAASPIVDFVVKTSAFTAVDGGKYALDTTNGGFGVTISSILPVGGAIEFIDVKGVWNTNAPTFLRNGFSIQGAAMDYTDHTQGASLQIVNTGGTFGLILLEPGAGVQSDGSAALDNNQTVGTTGNVTGNGHWTGFPQSITYQWGYNSWSYNGDGSNIDGTTNLGTGASQLFDWNLWRDPNQTVNGQTAQWIEIWCKFIGTNYVDSFTVTKSFNLVMPAYPTLSAFYRGDTLSDSKASFADLTAVNGAAMILDYDVVSPDNVNYCADFTAANQDFTVENASLGGAYSLVSLVRRTNAQAKFPIPTVLFEDDNGNWDINGQIDLSSYMPNDTGWHHVVLVNHGLVWTQDWWTYAFIIDLYVDGVAKIAGGSYGGMWANSPHGLLSLNGTGGVGRVSKVAVLDHPATANEASWLYNNANPYRLPSF